MSEAADLTVTSVEHDGRVLSGVGVEADDLRDVMEARSGKPAEAQATPPADPPPTVPPPTPSEPGPPSAPIEEPKKSRGQKRFDELTRERHEAERRAQQAEQQLAALRTQLHQQQPRPAPPAPQPAPAPEPPKTRAKPSEDQVGSVYATYADFIEDLADWKAEQRLGGLDLDAQIRRRIDADRAARTLQDDATKVYTAAKQLMPNFDAAWQAIYQQLGPQPRLGPSEASDFQRFSLIASSPHAPSILVAFASNPALIPQLAQLDDFAFVRAIDALAPAAAVASPASTMARSPVDAPPPYQPVGSGSKTTTPASADLIKKAGYDYDKSGYREKRAAERGVRRLK